MPQLAENVIAKIREFDPEVNKLEEIYNLLLDQQDNIKNLKVGYGPHPITERLVPLRKKRLMYAASIVYKMNLIVREDSYPNRTEVIESRIVINNYLLNLSASKNEEVVAERLEQFSKFMVHNPKYSTSFQTFKLNDDIDKLEETNSEIKLLLMQRADSISERPRVKTPVLVKSIQKALKDMFKDIETAQLRYPDVDYSSLINQLNDLFSHYRMLINTRASINKRRAASLENGGKDTQTPIEPNAPVDPNTPGEGSGDATEPVETEGAF